MSQAKKKRTGKLSPFARAMIQANALLEGTLAQEARKSEMVRIGRRTMRVGDLAEDLTAVRSRVEALFSQPNMGADAIRRRVNRDAAQEEDRPFTVMAGQRRRPGLRHK
ncbi:hypothetical protein [Cupriavidus taiwanensis]|uniref:hypothetical protein n=1 Tax=Cupriavidus taiwanensis TaxID=164546 RepID=UPI000E2F597C|nr:hypothetical protein [Cupriavidus taiwanensis]